MTRSELDRFASVLTTPCRCGRKCTAANLSLAKSAFANHTLSLPPRQSKPEGEFIPWSLKDVAPAAVRRTAPGVSGRPVAFVAANDEQRERERGHARRVGRPKKSDRVLPRAL